MIKTDLKTGLILACFALLCIAIVTLTALSTRDAITATEQKRLQSQLSTLLSSVKFDNKPASDVVMISHRALGSDLPMPVYRATLNGEVAGAVVAAIAANGYNGAIHLLIGLNAQGDVTGVRVTEHQETPGLGDDIDERRSDWIYSFDKLSAGSLAAEDWQVKKDGGIFDQFTGATITPRAVIHAVHKVVEWFPTAKQHVFSMPAVINNESGV